MPKGSTILKECDSFEIALKKKQAKEEEGNEAYDQGGGKGYL